MTIRVVVADGQELVRAGFKKLRDAEDAIKAGGEAADGLEALSLARRLDPTSS